MKFYLRQEYLIIETLNVILQTETHYDEVFSQSDAVFFDTLMPQVGVVIPSTVTMVFRNNN